MLLVECARAEDGKIGVHSASHVLFNEKYLSDRMCRRHKSHLTLQQVTSMDAAGVMSSRMAWTAPVNSILLAAAKVERAPGPAIKSAAIDANIAPLESESDSKDATTQEMDMSCDTCGSEGVVVVISCDKCGAECSNMSWTCPECRRDLCMACKPSGAKSLAAGKRKVDGANTGGPAKKPRVDLAALSAAASSMLASMKDSLPPEGFKTLADGVATTLGAKFTELANTPMETD
jgi:hypothetical protein